MTDTQTPLIEAVNWGRLEVAGAGCFKDAKVFPGGAREWDWRETGTRHVPGIQPEDVEELLDHGAGEIVLSRGMWRALRVCKRTLAMVQRHGIPVYVLETRAAVKRLNTLREDRAVGGLFHTTC